MYSLSGFVTDSGRGPGLQLLRTSKAISKKGIPRKFRLLSVELEKIKNEIKADRLKRKAGFSLQYFQM